MGGRGQQYTPYWYGNLWYTTSLQYAGGIPEVPYQYGLYCQAWPAPPSLIPAAYYQDLAGPASPCLIPAAYSQGSGLASLPFIDTSCILSASPSLIPAAYYGPASATLALLLAPLLSQSPPAPTYPSPSTHLHPPPPPPPSTPSSPLTFTPAFKLSTALLPLQLFTGRLPPAQQPVIMCSAALLWAAAGSLFNATLS